MSGVVLDNFRFVNCCKFKGVKILDVVLAYLKMSNSQATHKDKFKTKKTDTVAI